MSKVLQSTWNVIQCYLLTCPQVSDEAERSLLVKLKTECGYQFTSKLEGMFNDIKTSREGMQDFRARTKAGDASTSRPADDDIELTVQVRGKFQNPHEHVALALKWSWCR